MFNFENKVAVVTGGAKGIGKCIVEMLEKCGARVAVIDVVENGYFIGDLAKKEDLAIGDLVFFEGRSRNGRVGHVGIVTEIYPNNNFKFIHSSTTNGVIISSSTEPYYSSRYLRGGRVIEGSKINENTYSTQKTIFISTY